MQEKSKEEKEELIQLYKQSGMSVRAFAEEFELNQKYYQKNCFGQNSFHQQIKKLLKR